MEVSTDGIKLHSKKFQIYITSVRTAAEMLLFCYFTHGGNVSEKNKGVPQL